MEPKPAVKGIIYEEGEHVLYHCRCGKGAHAFFWVLMALVSLLLIPSVLVNVLVAIGIKEESVNVNFGMLGATIPFLAVVVIALVVLFFMRIIMLNHDYLVTDRRIIVGSGKGMKRGRRILRIDQVSGVSINQSLILSLFHLSAIDFYSAAASARVRTFLIFSFSSTPIKFDFLSKTDADAIFALLEKNITFQNKKD